MSEFGKNSITVLVAFLFVLFNGVLVLGVVPVGVAVEAVASGKFGGISIPCWEVGDCITGLWLISDACNMVVTSVTAKLEAVEQGDTEVA